MTKRILIFGDHDETRNLFSFFLRSKGYEVLHFPDPASCALIVEKRCTCPRDHMCADFILADMEMQGMTGLELIRCQKEMGCHAPPQNKAVFSTGLTPNQQQEVRALGCKSLQMPFRLQSLLAWINECEANIPSGRKLVPYQALLKTAHACKNADYAMVSCSSPASAPFPYLRSQ
jgi:CheY-like chemotaxis protein